MTRLHILHSCRWCSQSLQALWSLGRIPIVNTFALTGILRSDPKYALTLMVCPNCGLVQLKEVLDPREIFTAYQYMTGASEPLIQELKKLAGSIHAKMGKPGKVLDIGANDGTLLSQFAHFGWQTLGVEPAGAMVAMAKTNGIELLHGFFSERMGARIRKKYGTFSVVTATHVLANIVDLHDFFSGVRLVLAEDGVLVLEVASFDVMAKTGIFDSVYHEHYSYFSRQSLRRILSDAGFEIVQLGTTSAQGGSIRVIGKLQNRKRFDFVQKAKRHGRAMEKLFMDFRGTTAVFGAPAKGVALLNLLGVTNSQVAFAVDSTPVKQGKYIPGTGIPVYKEAYLADHPVDRIIVLSWNYRHGILKKLKQLVKYPVKIVFPFQKKTV